MESKPGIRTTEFWTSVITGLYLVLNTTGVLSEVPKSWATVALAIVSAFYALSRGQAKQGVAYTPPS